MALLVAVPVKSVTPLGIAQLTKWCVPAGLAVKVTVLPGLTGPGVVPVTEPPVTVGTVKVGKGAKLAVSATGTAGILNTAGVTVLPLVSVAPFTVQSTK
jgi:hypothetical protein